jgi:hypothetical protein
MFQAPTRTSPSAYREIKERSLARSRHFARSTFGPFRTKFQIEGRIRDLALFNAAIDSKLRGCDVVALKVDDVAPSGYAADRASVRKK